MILYVLIVAVVNMAIGYALGVKFPQYAHLDIAWDRLIPSWRIPWRRSAPLEASSTTVDEPPPEPPPTSVDEIVDSLDDLAEPEPEPPRSEDDIPQEWLDMLDETIECNTFVEASVQVLKLEVGRYRDELIRIDDKVRGFGEDADQAAVDECLVELKQCNERWLSCQAEAAGHLTSRQGGLGDFSEMGAALEEILLEQTAQIETTCSNIEHLDFATNLVEGCRRLVGEISKLVDMAHALRDRMQESLLSIMRHEKRLDAVDKRLQLDSLTGLVNRTGLEKVFDEWWFDDPNRIRQVSVAELDLDQLGRFNQKYGTRAGDKLLGGFGHLLDGLVRKDRGYDVASRFAGQRFMLFFGDTGPRNATSAVERIRQTIEETSFELGDEELAMTVSCGVTEIGPRDDTHTLFKRLRKAVRAAKSAGRNTTFLDEGGGAQAVAPPTYEVKGRIVRLDE